MTSAGLKKLYVDESRSNGEWTLRSDDPPLFDGEEAWTVLPLTVNAASAREYFFGLRVRFQTGRGDRFLLSASMIVGARLVNKAPDPPNPLQPVVRAELDTNDRSHAQPHWHIYGPSEASGEPAGEDPLSKLFSRIELVHWAMCAEWPILGNEPAAHSPKLATADCLAKWLGGCIAYVRSQLEYLESRIPARPRNYFESVAARNNP